MKPYIALSAILVAMLLVACSARGEVRVVRQEIAVLLVPPQHLVVGESTLHLAPGAAGELSLALNGSARLEAVRLDGRDIPFRREGGALRLNLPVGTGERRVTVAYRCIFNDPAPERPVVTEDPSYGVSAVVAERGTYLGSGAGWYPEPTAPPGSRIVTVRAPEGIEAVTAGRRAARATAGGVTTSVWEEEHPAEALSLSAGAYVVAERNVDGIPLYTYLYPENAALADRYLEASAGYLRFYAEKFGPYPFEKFAVVENFFPTGYGFPSYTLIGGTVIRLPFIVHTSLPHEIAHCWWGNGVLVAYDRGNWSEGLVTYLADHLLEERKSARDGRDYRYRLLADYASLVPAGEDFPLRRFLGRVDPASRAIGYGKGAMLFHMVRREIGDDAFFGALRQVFREFRFKAASWDDFALAFSRASGRDMVSFMNPWLERTGGPRLALAEVKRRQVGDGWLVSGVVRQEGDAFPGRVRARVDAGGTSRDSLVETTGGRTGFTVAVSGPPERVTLDPEADTFRLLSPEELPATVNRIKGSTALTVVTAPGCGADRDTLALLLRSLDQAEAPLIRQDQVDAAALAGRDILFCGVPGTTGIRSPLPHGVSASAGAFAVDGTTYAGAGDMLFAVATRPDAPGRVTAFLHSLSPAAAGAAALKITHYGRYGVLVFSGGNNRVKEAPPALSETSVVTFDRQVDR